MEKHTTPSDIEQTSLKIISEELEQLGIRLAEENEAVIKRVIHASADFDYARNLVFTSDACSRAQQSLLQGTPIVTDTNMARSGISRLAMEKLGVSCICLMAEERVAQRAREENTTRAVISMKLASEQTPDAIFAIGNAPTALFALSRLIQNGLRPSLVVAVPVGFVNVVEAKEEIFSLCTEKNIPCIAAMGRKGGSTIAAAVCNALLYSAAQLANPRDRGWN